MIEGLASLQIPPADPAEGEGRTPKAGAETQRELAEWAALEAEFA